MVMTKIDICNQALLGVGHSRKIVTATEDTPEKNQTFRVYEPARRSLLQMGRWGFATDVVTLVDTGNTPIGWDYEYVYPMGTLKALEIARASSDQDPIPYKTASTLDATTGAQRRVIWTNEAQASLLRIRDVQLSSMFTPLFDQCLACLMGVMGLARTIAKSENAVKESWQALNYWYGQAVQQGEVEAEDIPTPDAPWITDR